MAEDSPLNSPLPNDFPSKSLCLRASVVGGSPLDGQRRPRRFRLSFDQLQSITLKYLGLPVPADPFWAAPPWLTMRRAVKHSKHPEIIGFRFQRPCAQ